MGEWKWLVIFPNAEFVVTGEHIEAARKAVEREARARGLKNRRAYDMYRMYDAVFPLSHGVNKSFSKEARVALQDACAAVIKERPGLDPGLDLTGKTDMDEVRRAFYGEE